MKADHQSIKNKPRTPRSKTDRRRRNALKHGIFASDVVILDESQKEFDELHLEFVKEYEPRGRAEKEAIFSIAKYHWYKRRIDRLLNSQAEVVEEPDSEVLVYVEKVYEQILMAGTNSSAWNAIIVLPQEYQTCITNKFSEPTSNDDEQWFRKFTAYLEELISIEKVAIAAKMKSPEFISDGGSRLFELTKQHLELNERLDRMIERAMRRFGMLRMYKEINRPEQLANSRQISVTQS